MVLAKNASVPLRWETFCFFSFYFHFSVLGIAVSLEIFDSVLGVLIMTEPELACSVFGKVQIPFGIKVGKK